MISDAPGWGTEPIEAALEAHPPKPDTGLLDYSTGVRAADATRLRR